ncbi:MAG TPA: GerMN domain-containing protein [Desulfosporosinus sp.]|nr:GerMN domain-containing protein [Desulfosporosinus sp.]
MFKHTFKTLFLTIATLLLVGIFLTGCTSEKTPTVKSADETTTKAPETNPTPTRSVSPERSVKLTLYFPNADASGLVATDRTVVVEEQEIIKTMVTELATPPTEMVKPLPEGTKLLGATVSADGVATIDLSIEFKQNFIGGSTGEQMAVYSIVNTLTTLDNIKSVQFLLDGKKQEVILHQLITSTPIERDESLIKK